MDLFDPTEEHALLRRTLRDFVAQEVEPQAAEHDRTETFNRALFQRVGELGLLGITVPSEHGGAGMDAVGAVIAHEELASSDPGFTLAYLAHSMLFVNNFFHNAGEAHRRRYLPKVVSGEWIGGMCMTEPGVGTDVLGLRTTAERQPDASWVMNGRKMFITNGVVDDRKTPGDIFLVYAKTSGRLSSFIVTRDAPGFSVGQKLHGKTGMRASPTAELVFDQCRLPPDALIGEEGAATLHMMRNLEIERVTLAAMSTGLARRCLQVMARYADERQAFGQPLAAFGQIQRHLAESYAHYRAARTYLYDTARKLHLGEPGHRVDADGVKLVCATMGKQVADAAMQVLGGYGYMGEYVVERLWRDAKLMEIGGGTLEAHQKNITKDLVRNIDAYL